MFAIDCGIFCFKITQIFDTFELFDVNVIQFCFISQDLNFELNGFFYLFGLVFNHNTFFGRLGFFYFFFGCFWRLCEGYCL